MDWVPGDVNLSDGLTKDSPEARKPMALWLIRKTWILRFDPDFVSARKRQKLKRMAGNPDTKDEVPVKDVSDEIGDDEDIKMSYAVNTLSMFG